MRAKPPENETPEQKFVRTAGVRVSNVVEACELLIRLGVDVPSDEFAQQAFEAVDASVARFKESWKSKKGTDRKRLFSFEVPVQNPNQIPIPQTASPVQAVKPVPATGKK